MLKVIDESLDALRSRVKKGINEKSVIEELSYANLND